MINLNANLIPPATAPSSDRVLRPLKKNKTTIPPQGPSDPWSEAEIDLLVDGVRENRRKKKSLANTLAPAPAHVEHRQNPSRKCKRVTSWEPHEIELLKMAFQAFPYDYALINRFFNGTRSTEELRNKVIQLELKADTPFNSPKTTQNSPQVSYDIENILASGSILPNLHLSEFPLDEPAPAASSSNGENFLPPVDVVILDPILPLTDFDSSSDYSSPLLTSEKLDDSSDCDLPSTNKTAAPNTFA